MKTFLKVLKIISDLICNTLIIGLLLLLMYVCYTRLIVKDPSMLINDYYFYRVVSGSMEPTLKVGDYILVHKEDKYQVGDIVTIKEANHYVTHRITKINNHEITLKGDANNTEDGSLITKNQIKGKFVKKINGFAKVHSFITNKHTLIIITAFLVIVRIGISLLWRLINKE